ncbi:MAG: hypothetical protein R3C53_02545 [Pirellulaceae bacterium]
MSDSVPNPFQPPVSVTSGPIASLDGIIPFQIHVETYDVEAAVRPSFGRLVWPVLLFMLAGLFCLSLISSDAAFSSRRAVSLLMAVLLFSLCGLSIWNFFTISRRIANGNPLALGQLYGDISEAGIRICSPLGESWHPIAALSSAAVNRRILIISFDRNLLTRYFFPERAFAMGDFDRVAAFLTAQAAHQFVGSKGNIVDDRLLDREKLLPLDLPPDAIPFAGCLTLDDLRRSNLKHRLRSLKRKILVCTVIVNLVVGVLILEMARAKLLVGGLALGGMLLWVNWRLLGQLRRGLGVGQQANQRLSEYHGGLTAENIYLASSVGRTRYRWAGFTQLTIADDIISLRLPGTFEQSIILPRSMFDDEAWLQAQAIVRQQCGHLLFEP